MNTVKDTSKTQEVSQQEASQRVLSLEQKRQQVRLQRCATLHGIPCTALPDGSIQATSCAIDADGNVYPDILVTDSIQTLKQWLGY